MSTHLDNSPEDKSPVVKICLALTFMIFGFFIWLGQNSPGSEKPMMNGPSPATMMASR